MFLLFWVCGKSGRSKPTNKGQHSISAIKSWLEPGALNARRFDSSADILEQSVAWRLNIGSNNPDGICAVINNACTLLESDFYRVCMPPDILQISSWERKLADPDPHQIAGYWAIVHDNGPDPHHCFFKNIDWLWLKFTFSNICFVVQKFPSVFR